MTEYRDPINGARIRADAARASIEAARAKLTPAARELLSDARRQKLTELEGILDRAVDDLATAAAIEEAAKEYEQCSRDALNLLAQLNAAEWKASPIRRH